MHQNVIVQSNIILTKVKHVRNVIINVQNVQMQMDVPYVLKTLIDIHQWIVNV